MEFKNYFVMENIGVLANARFKTKKDLKSSKRHHKAPEIKTFNNSRQEYSDKASKADFKSNCRFMGVQKVKTKKKRTTKSNGQKELSNVSPVSNFKITASKLRAQSNNPKSGCILGSLKPFSLNNQREARVEGYCKRASIRSKAGSTSNYSNNDSSKASSFKILNKSIQRNKTKEKLSISGSVKAGRQTNGYISSKKRLKIKKGKICKEKENMSQKINIHNERVNAVKSLIKFNKKNEKSVDLAGSKNNTSGNQEFISPNGETGNIKNMIKLHLPTEKKDMMMYKQSK